MREVPRKSKKFRRARDVSKIESLRRMVKFPAGILRSRRMRESTESRMRTKCLAKVRFPSGRNLRSRGRRRKQEPEEHEESQEDKTLDQDEVPEQEQEQEKVSKQYGESQEDESLDQDKDNQDEQSKLRTVPELAQPTPVDIAKPKSRKLEGRLVGKMLEDSGGITKFEDPRDSDVVIP